MELKKYDEYINVIEKVYRESIAEEVDIEPGDILVSINGEKVKDIIDYKYLITDEYVEVDIEKGNGDLWTIEIEKEFDEDLGIEFTNPLIDKAKSCMNNCIFCFIDQLPKGMRDTLYFKDDDSRLSFLQGNFITLTNMSDEEIDRIIKYRISPVNVSVHTTNPELRIKMMNNKNAGKIFTILKRFNEAGIEVNCQIVLVPGVNDGKELERTLTDLSSLYPNVESVAVVPVGITKYRQGLHKVEPFNKETAMDLLYLIEKEQNRFMNTINTRFVFASDEFYALSDYPTPSYEEYEGFPQLENGVGLMKKFEYDIDLELDETDENNTLNKSYVIATGKLAESFMNKIKGKLTKKFRNVNLEVYPIENNFFGKLITVSGLITGQDIVAQLKDHKDIDGIIIPKSMLRDSTNVFLDDLTVSNIQDKLKIEIIPIEVNAKEFIEFFTNKRGDKIG